MTKDTNIKIPWFTLNNDVGSCFPCSFITCFKAWKFYRF